MLSLRGSPARRRRAWSAALAVVAVSGLVAAPAAPAHAQPDCGWVSTTHPNGDEVWVWTCEDGGGGPGSGGDLTCTINNGQVHEVPCVDASRGWFTPMFGGCYISPTTPQPDAGDPAWEGNDPDDGVVYTAFCFATDGVDGQPYVDQPIQVFLSAVDGQIADLIEQAIGLLELRGADIHLAPSPDGAGLVGLPVWMWTPVTSSTWGPASDSLTALGMTITVTANAERIRWDMGDGTEVVCDGPGTPYQPEFGADPPPGCDPPHAYERPSRTQPDGRYQITAVTEWRIDWQIEGTAIDGFELATRSSTASVRINELQVVTS